MSVNTATDYRKGLRDLPADAADPRIPVRVAGPSLVADHTS